MKVKLFGRLAELAGNKEIEIGKVYDKQQLQAILREEYPELAKVAYAIAVDRQVICGNVGLSELSEIALLPPFSGG